MKKSADFRWCAHRSALGAFLRDTGGKIVGIQHGGSLGTTLATLT